MTVCCAFAFIVVPRFADAHVTIVATNVEPGHVAELSFRCPNERPTAATTKLVVQMPPDSLLSSVRPRTMPGWRITTTMRPLPAPVVTSHGTVVATVDTITWEGGTIPPGQYQDFTILAGPIPANAGELVFKAVQTYSNGEVVRWIQPRVAGQPEPERPAPTLTIH